MKRTLLVLLTAPALAATGCLTLTPVGPMAKTLGTSEPPTQPAPGVTVTAAQDAPPGGPVLQPAPPPPAPALLVTPGEVTKANAADAASRLQEEFRADRRTMESMPRYSEVSVVKGSR